MIDIIEQQQREIAAAFIVPVHLLVPLETRYREFLRAIEPIQRQRLCLLSLCPMIVDMVLHEDGTLEVVPATLPAEVQRVLEYFDQLVAAHAKHWGLA